MPRAEGQTDCRFLISDYATQAALEASADAGYDQARYDELGTLWFIREAGIKYHRPAQCGDALNVKTWVGDFRRMRSRREYELTLASTGQLAASAYTNWIYLSAETGQLVRIPQELIAAFFPEGTPPEAPRRKTVPRAASAPARRVHRPPPCELAAPGHGRAHEQRLVPQPDGRSGD